MVNILHRIPLIRHYARKWEFAYFQKNGESKTAIIALLP